MKLKTEYGLYEIASAKIEHYQYGGGLAINLNCLNEEWQCEEPFATITVNLDSLYGERLKENEAFVDTNNCPWAEKWIVENKFGKPTGIMERSGYCIYPLYEFDLEKLNAVFGDD